MVPLSGLLKLKFFESGILKCLWLLTANNATSDEDKDCDDNHVYIQKDIPIWHFQRQIRYIIKGSVSM